jgi:mannose-6-phosphate isomerase-like protein (cupin superfamily)
VNLVEGEVERFDLLGFEVTLFGGSADAAFSVQEWRASAGAGGIPIHLHHGTEEAFYVVAGDLGLWLDDRAVMRPSGSYTVVPPGRRHSFWNPGDGPATYLTVISPSGFERYFVELASGLQHVATDQEAAALRKRLGTLYDITVVGPPPQGTV